MWYFLETMRLGAVNFCKCTVRKVRFPDHGFSTMVSGHKDGKKAYFRRSFPPNSCARNAVENIFCLAEGFAFLDNSGVFAGLM